MLSPQKVLVLLSAYRNLVHDTMAVTTTEAINELLVSRPADVTLGGADAAIHWLGGRNTVATVSTRLVYVDEVLPAESGMTLAPGDEVRVVVRDAVARRTWSSGFTSLAQTYADLFAMPGWQAAEFRAALDRRLFAEPDWDQKARDDG